MPGAAVWPVRAPMQSIKKSAAVVGVYAKQAEHQTATGTHHVAELDKLVD